MPLRDSTGSTGARRFTSRTPPSVRNSAITSSDTKAEPLTSTSCPSADFVQEDFIGSDRSDEFFDDRATLVFHPEQRFETIADQGHFEAVHGDDFHHASARGNGDERSPLPGVAERKPIGIGMRIGGVHGFDTDADTCVPQGLGREGQALVRSIPAHQAAEQPHVGTLRFVRGGQRAIAVELDEQVVDLAVHQVAGDPPDPQRRGAMGTRRPAHHGADHVVEDTDNHHWAVEAFGGKNEKIKMGFRTSGRAG